MRTSAQSQFTYLSREALLLFLSAYVILIAGGFGAMVDFRRQLFSAVLAVVVLGGWLLIRLSKREPIHGSGIDWAVAAFLGSQLIAVLFSEDVRRSLPHAGLWLVYFLAFYFSFDTLRRGWPEELYVKCLLIAGAVLLVFSSADLVRLLSEWRRLTVGLEFVPRFEHRLGTILGDPNLLASFTNLLVPLAIASYLLNSNKVARVALAAYVGISLVILFFTDSRGGLLGLAAAITVLSTLWVIIVSKQARMQTRRWAEWIWRRKALLIVGIVLVMTFIGFAAWKLLSFQGSTTHAPVAEARDIFWQAATNALRSDPLTGAGPGMYPNYLMKIWSTPPARPYLHAHSFPFQMAAESGLLGLAAGALLLIMIFFQAREGWRRLSMQEQGIRAAALSSLVGLGAHSLVDNFFPFPAVGLTTMILLAISFSPVRAKKNSGSLTPWALAIPGLALVAFSFYTLRAFFYADKAVSLTEIGDWQAIAETMSTAASHDPDFGFYWLQAGYAYGRVAESDPQFLDEAIAAYQHGIELEPQYALNHANLSALLWADSQVDLSLGEMPSATDLAPDSWLLWLNRGVIEEAAGDLSAASDSYKRAINLRPEILGAAFWYTTDLRDGTAIRNADSTATEIDPRNRAIAAAEEARELVQVGQFDAAESLFEEAYQLNDQEVALYLGLAERALALHDLGTAEQYAQLALWVPTTSNQVKAEVILLAAEISLANGDKLEALRRYQIAYDAIFANTSYGWASAGWSPYAWFVWQRPAFPEDLLPMWVRADITTEIADRLMQLAELYEKQGELESAIELRERLQIYFP
ncbi:MAG: O-antigen ligase family protein [Anaerolineales bacterium]